MAQGVQERACRGGRAGTASDTGERSPVSVYLLPTLTVGKGVDSWARLCRRISVTGSALVGVVPFCIHGWLKMSSKDGLSEGLRDRHHLISC